ncbi:MAG TPA: tetratricopeptide repeat protein [Myxococcota bacterium]|nr:tetratricopeptide repeat protein [Myxococcota bacterium]
MAINKRKILESAQKHLQRGALDRALKDYQALLEADPRDTNIRLKIGDLHLRRGDTNEAIGAYLKVGAQFMKDGFDAKAVAIYKQIAKIDPARAEVNEPLAELYQRMGLPSEAMGALQAAADTHHKAGRKREALESLRKMASLDPTNTSSRLKVAELLRQAKLEGEAIAEYESVAGELERQGDTEGLAAVLEKILELAPDRLATVEQVARLHLRLNQVSRAEPFVRRLVDAHPDAPAGYELLAEVHRAGGREGELLELYRRLADVYRQRGDEDKAREIHQRFLPPTSLAAREDTLPPPPPAPTAPLDADLAADLDGALEFDAEDLGAEEIVDEFSAAQISLEDSAAFRRELVTDDPAGAVFAPAPAPAAPASTPEPAPEGDPEQLLAEASVYLRYGKHDRAVAALEAILARDPRHRAALEKLGETFATKGQAPQAVQSWLRAAELARAEQDGAGHESLRGRIAGLDPKAAQSLPTLKSVGPAPPAPPPAAAATELDDRTFPDLEFEVEIDAAAQPLAVPAPQSADEPAREPAGEAAPEEESLPPHIGGELEEARFYREQNLLDDAERIYRRVLAAVPGHTPALLGLGEIAAARGAARPAPTPERAAPGAAPDPFADFDDDTPPEAPDLEPFGLDPEPAAATHAEPSGLRPAPVPAETTAPDFEAPQTSFDAEPFPELSDSPAADAFDLAAALSADLETGDAGAGGVATDEDGFLALFRDFKRGVEQQLGETDGEARYDLGIAYREMGLLEDALQEFGAAVETPARHLDALHMLGICSLELGRGQDAIAHFGRALASPDVPTSQQAALRLDLGRAHESLGERELALEAYRSAGTLDPELPGLAARIASLESAGIQAPSSAGETYESFEDLLADKDEAGAGEATGGAEPSYESFQDVMADAADGDAREENAEQREPARERPPVEDEAPAPPAPKASRRKKISFV